MDEADPSNCLPYVLRAVKVLKAKFKSPVTELSAEEMQQSELKCYMWIQQGPYKEDYEQLKARVALPRSSRLLKLDSYYYKADQVVSVGGRLQFADIPEETKHQVILPYGHLEVAKMILDVHKQIFNAGVINSRPLTAVSDDHKDPAPISHAHLAIDRPLNQLPDVNKAALRCPTIMYLVENVRWLEFKKFTVDGIILCERQQYEPRRVFYADRYRLEVESTTPQVIPEEVSLRGGEKNKTNIVHSEASTVPVSKPNRSVVHSDRGQAGENVTANYTRRGTLCKKPEILD
ncbi:hypothetical protein ACROYT_G004933 [Oculina patagonica]